MNERHPGFLAHQLAQASEESTWGEPELEVAIGIVKTTWGCKRSPRIPQVRPSGGADTGSHAKDWEDARLGRAARMQSRAAFSIERAIVSLLAKYFW